MSSTASDLGQLGVNLLWLRPGEVGGTETYARRVLTALAADSPDLSIHLFGTAPGIEAVTPANATVTAHTAASTALPPTRRLFVERTWLPGAVKAAGLDVLHHLGGTVPINPDVASLVTIHDLQPLDHPDNFSSTKIRFLQRAIPAAIERAGAVATPSEWVREEVISRFDLNADEVLAVSAFADPVDLATPAQPSALISHIVSQGPTLLYPAMTLNHKNHRLLFDAFADAVRRDPELQLVCVGSPGRDDAEIRAHADSVSARIHMLGYVSRADLDSLYRSADALVFPSRYEGFGLPILEAQNYGLPVICSNVTAMPEVAGDGARLIDPLNPGQWADAMTERFTPVDRARLVAAGFENARRYSIEATAAQQKRAYAQVGA